MGDDAAQITEFLDRHVKGPASELRVVFFTGAGISVAAGLPTYRGTSGLWTSNPELEQLLHVRRLDTHLHLMWQHFADIRAHSADVRPTAAHQTIASLEAHVARVDVVTQNVDGLHHTAGSSRVLELHGSIMSARCTNPTCDSRPRFDTSPPDQIPPVCAVCGDNERPDVVLFGENLDPTVFCEAADIIDAADLVVAVGTSGTVWPARGLIDPQPDKVPVLICTPDRWDDPHSDLHNPYKQVGWVDVDADRCLDVVASWITAARTSGRPHIN